MCRFCQGLKKRRGVKRVAPTSMDEEATRQRESEEAEQLEREMREIEELLPQVKGEELRRTLQEKYYQLLKKLKKESEETKSEESESEAESEAEPEAEPKVEHEVEPEEKEKLHGIKKFKIDEAMIDRPMTSLFIWRIFCRSISKTMKKCANI
jgi:hypothetical protein